MPTLEEQTIADLREQLARARKINDDAERLRAEMTAEHATVQKLCRRWLGPGETHKDLPGVLEAMFAAVKP